MVRSGIARMIAASLACPVPVTQSSNYAVTDFYSHCYRWAPTRRDSDSPFSSGLWLVTSYGSGSGRGRCSRRDS